MSGLLARASRNIGFKAIAEILSRLIYLVFFLILARRLGDSAFGVFSFAFSFTGILAILVDPGLNLTLTRDVAEQKNRATEYVTNLLSLKLGLGVVTVLLAIVWNIIMGYDDRTTIVVNVTALYSVFNALIEFQIALFNGYERMEYDALVKIISKILVSAAGVCALFLGADVIGVVAVITAAMLMSVVYGFVVIHRKFVHVRLGISWSFASKIMWKASPIALMMVLNVIYFKIDIVLMQQLHIPANNIGWYAASSRIVEMLNVVPALVVGGLFPVLATLWGSDPGKANIIVARTFQFLIICIVPVVMIAFFHANEVIHLLYGVGFANAAFALSLLTWSALFNYPNFLLSNLFVVLNQQKWNAVFSFIAVVVNVVANLVLLHMYGFIGACIAAVVTSGVLFALNITYVARTIRILPLFRSVISPVVGAVAMAATLFALRDIEWIGAVAVAVLLYLVCIVVFGGIKREELIMLKTYIAEYVGNSNKQAS